MPRKKVKLQWIANDAANRATLKKRRTGLMKKVRELSILCNVKACAVVYGPAHDPSRPEAWPSAEEAAALLRGFRGMPEHEQGRRRVDQEGFLRQWAQKLRDQIDREKKEAARARAEFLMAEFLRGAGKVEGIAVEEIMGVACLVETKLKEVQARIELLRGPPPPPMSTSMLQPPLPPSTTSTGLEMADLRCPGVAAARSKQTSMTTDHHVVISPGALLHGAAAMTLNNNVAAEEGAAASRPDQLMEMMGLCRGLLYGDQQEEEGMPPASAAVAAADDGGKSPWMMDAFLPFD